MLTRNDDNVTNVQETYELSIA